MDNLKALFLSHINRVDSRPLSKRERSCESNAEYPGEYYLKRVAVGTLLWLMPMPVLEKIALELLWEKRTDYFDFERLLKKASVVVSRAELIKSVEKWDLCDAHPWLTLDLMNGSNDKLWVFAQNISAEKRFPFLENVWLRSINTAMCDKYTMSDWEMVSKDIDIAELALRTTTRVEHVQRIYDGVRLHLQWEKAPPRMQEKVAAILEHARGMVGVPLNDDVRESPYQLINPLLMMP